MLVDSRPSAVKVAEFVWQARVRHAPMLLLHADLLRPRREDPTIAAQDWTCLDGVVLGEKAFLLHWFGRTSGDRLLDREA